MRSLVTKEAIGAGVESFAEFEFSAKSLTQVCLLFLSTYMYLHIEESENL
jgi:hypothetical protein